MFENDLKNEEIISNWIYENGLSKIDLDYRRETSVNGQNSGIDLWIKCREWFRDDEYHAIDEKSASNYIRINTQDNQLPTFAFELDYYNEKNRIRSEGWLFGQKSRATEFYMISWLWAGNYVDNQRLNNRDLDVKDIKYDYFTKARVMLISKEKLHNYLKEIKVNAKNFMKISHEIRNNRKENSIPIGINGKYPKIVYSQHLREKPVNIVIPVNILKKISENDFLFDILEGE